MRKIGLTGLVAAVLLLPVAAASAQNRPAPNRPTAPAPARPAQAVQPTRPPQQQSQIPQAAGLIVLIRSSLTALHQANQTGNYQVLYALGSDGLRAQTNPQNLAQSFAAFRQRQIDLSPVLFLNPNLSRPAAIEGGRLHLVGSFPTSPLRINFDFWFEPSQGQWKFIQLNTNLSPAQVQNQGQSQSPGQARPAPPPQVPQQQRR